MLLLLLQNSTLKFGVEISMGMLHVQVWLLSYYHFEVSDLRPHPRQWQWQMVQCNNDMPAEQWHEATKSAWEHEKIKKAKQNKWMQNKPSMLEMNDTIIQSTPSEPQFQTLHEELVHSYANQTLHNIIPWQNIPEPQWGNKPQSKVFSCQMGGEPAKQRLAE